MSLSFGLELLTRAEYENALTTIPEKECSFCAWEKYQIRLHEGDHWVWIACRAPYWKYHTMLIPKEHRVQMSDLTVAEMGELFEMYSWAVDRFRTKVNQDISLIFFRRFRDGSVVTPFGVKRPNHFHLHLTPDREGLFDPLLEQDATKWDWASLIK